MFSYDRSMESFFRLYEEKVNILEQIYIDKDVIDPKQLQRLEAKIIDIDSALFRISKILEEHRYNPLEIPLVTHKLGTC